MFKSTVAGYRPRLRWRFGVPLCSLIPLILATGFMEALQVASILAPRWRSAVPPRMMATFALSFEWPYLAAMWATQHLGVPFRWADALIAAELFAFGTAMTWMIRSAERRMFRRLSDAVFPAVTRS